MRQKNSKKSWVTLVSAFWLALSVHLFAAVPSTVKESAPTYSETIVETSYDTLIEIPQGEIHWLVGDGSAAGSFVLAMSAYDWLAVVEAALWQHVTVHLPLPALPEQSRLSTYHNIVSYQYFISSLSAIS